MPTGPRPTTKRPRRPVRWRPRPAPIAAMATMAFLAVGGLIGVRVAAGDDPALAARSAALTQTATPATSSSASSDATSSAATQSSSSSASPDTGGSTASVNPSTGTSGG